MIGLLAKKIQKKVSYQVQEFERSNDFFLKKELIEAQEVINKSILYKFTF